MSVLIWENPPKPTSRATRTNWKWGPIVAELASRPGEWAIVGEQINSGMAKYLREKFGVETALRVKMPDGRYEKLYARMPEVTK